MMKAATVFPVLLLHLYVILISVHESEEVLVVLTHGKYSGKTNERPVDTASSSTQAKPERQPPFQRLSWPKKRPNRFPEGPMFDSSSRTRLNSK